MSILLFSMACSVNAQWMPVEIADFNKAMLAVNKDLFNQQRYGFTAKQSFFKSSESKDTINKMDYSYAYNKSLDLLNISELGTFLIQDKTIQVRIDSIEQIIIISPANLLLTQKNFKDAFSKDTPINYQVFKKYQANQTIYKMKFDTLSHYSSIDIVMDKKGDIKKAIFIAGRPIQDMDSDEISLIFPKMEIEYTGFISGDALSATSFVQMSSIFTDSNYINLQWKYKDYEVVDTRKKEENK